MPEPPPSPSAGVSAGVSADASSSVASLSNTAIDSSETLKVLSLLASTAMSLALTMLLSR